MRTILVLGALALVAGVALVARSLGREASRRAPVETPTPAVQDSGSAPRPPAAGKEPEREPALPAVDAVPAHAAPADARRADAGPASGPAPPPLEPLDIDQRMQLAQRVPSGRIEGVVLRGSEPVAGAEVHLWPLDGAPDTVLDGESNGVWIARTGPSGEFGFDVDPSLAHRLEARLASGQRISSLWSPRSPNRRVVLYFGSASLQGTLQDSQGLPLAGALVQVSEMGPAPGGSGRHAATHTDSEGAWTLGGLYGGVWKVRWYTSGVSHGIEDGARSVQLEDGGSATLALVSAPPH